MGFILAIITFLFSVTRGYFGDIAGIKKTLHALAERVVSLETKIDPFWKIICRELPNMLTPNPYDKALVVKVCNDKASPEELYSLQKQIKQELPQMQNPIPAIITLSLIEMRLNQKGLKCDV